MKLGFVSAIVPELSFEQVVDFASAQGFACVEMMCWPKGMAERRYGGSYAYRDGRYGLSKS
jgi:sugar phosphate isomerase/epimerase